MVRKEDLRILWSTLELETRLKEIISKEEEKGGARMQDCIGMVKWYECKGEWIQVVLGKWKEVAHIYIPGKYFWRGCR